jgi:hypothetical protein
VGVGDIRLAFIVQFTLARRQVRFAAVRLHVNFCARAPIHQQQRLAKKRSTYLNRDAVRQLEQQFPPGQWDIEIANKRLHAIGSFVAEA